MHHDRSHPKCPNWRKPLDCRPHHPRLVLPAHLGCLPHLLCPVRPPDQAPEAPVESDVACDERLVKRDWLGFAALALCAYLVSCLRRTQEETTKAVSTATTSIATAFTKSISEVTAKQTALTEVLLVGRDSPSPNGSSPTNLSEFEDSKPPE